MITREMIFEWSRDGQFFVLDGCRVARGSDEARTEFGYESGRTVEEAAAAGCLYFSRDGQPIDDCHDGLAAA